MATSKQEMRRTKHRRRLGKENARTDTYAAGSFGLQSSELKDCPELCWKRVDGPPGGVPGTWMGSPTGLDSVSVRPSRPARICPSCVPGGFDWLARSESSSLDQVSLPSCFQHKLPTRGYCIERRTGGCVFSMVYPAINIIIRSLEGGQASTTDYAMIFGSDIRKVFHLKNRS